MDDLPEVTWSALLVLGFALFCSLVFKVQSCAERESNFSLQQAHVLNCYEKTKDFDRCRELVKGGGK